MTKNGVGLDTHGIYRRRPLNTTGTLSLDYVRTVPWNKKAWERQETGAHNWLSTMLPTAVVQGGRSAWKGESATTCCYMPHETH